MSIRMPIRQGDVVLTSSSGLLAGVNRLGQFLVKSSSETYPEYTHVAVCVVPDVLLDARPFVHIKLRNIVDEVKDGHLTAEMGKNHRLCVLRARRLDDDQDALDEALESLALPLLAQLKKQYNWLFTLPNPSDKDSTSEKARRAFCSELCVLMLKELNILPENWATASATMPSDFQDLKDNQSWLNVTQEWCEQLNKIERGLRNENEADSHFTNKRKESADLWIEVTKGWLKVEMGMKMISERDKKLDEQMQQLIKNLKNALR